MIQTQRLFLIPTDLPKLEAIVDQDWATLSDLLGGVDFADNWYHFPEAMVWARDYLREFDADIRWWNYLIIHQSEARVIGTCGYKGPPSFQGDVEIGYEIAPAYQGNGYATEAAAALVTAAFKDPAVRHIDATTLGETNASNHLLQKLGFQFTGEEVDLEVGKVWCWRLERPASQ